MFCLFRGFAWAAEPAFGLCLCGLLFKANKRPWKLLRFDPQLWEPCPNAECWAFPLGRAIGLALNVAFAGSVFQELCWPAVAAVGRVLGAASQGHLHSCGAVSRCGAESESQLKGCRPSVEE